MPHPAVSVLGIGGFFLFIKSLISHITVYKFEELVYAYKLPFVFIISFFIPLLYFLLKKNNFLPKIALIACILLAVNPLIWVSNAADILFAIFSILSVFTFFIYIDCGGSKNKYFLLSAILAGLSIINRLTGILLIIIIPFLTLIYKNRLQSSWKKIFFKLFVWLMLVAASVIILWPNLWLFRSDQKNQLIQNYQTVSSLENSYFADGFNFLGNIKNTLYHIPLIELYFLLMFVVFLKNNLFLSFKKKNVVDTKITGIPSQMEQA
jgi:4-amino-4-deoxy-L-arabinose transferase-like glycosyltransferase